MAFVGMWGISHARERSAAFAGAIGQLPSQNVRTPLEAYISHSEVFFLESRSLLFSLFLLVVMSSPITPEVALANLQATALTARCHNALFRLKQLKSLHDALRNKSTAIKDALKQDTHVSEEEAITEVALALDVVKEHYGSIDATKELEAEYRITNGKDANDRREPWGVAYIEPQRSHTPFFSVIAPLSAGLAAGSCVALKVC
jgi:hypothetical protein